MEGREVAKYFFWKPHSERNEKMELRLIESHLVSAVSLLLAGFLAGRSPVAVECAFVLWTDYPAGCGRMVDCARSQNRQLQIVCAASRRKAAKREGGMSEENRKRLCY